MIQPYRKTFIQRFPYTGETDSIMIQNGKGISEIGRIYKPQIHFQRGRGIGNIFAGLMRKLMPALNTGLRAIGEQALKTGDAILHDIGKRDLGDSLREHGKAGLTQLAEKGINKLFSQRGRGYGMDYNTDLNHSSLGIKRLPDRRIGLVRSRVENQKLSSSSSSIPSPTQPISKKKRKHSMKKVKQAKTRRINRKKKLLVNRKKKNQQGGRVRKTSRKNTTSVANKKNKKKSEKRKKRSGRQALRTLDIFD